MKKVTLCALLAAVLLLLCSCVPFLLPEENYETGDTEPEQRQLDENEHYFNEYLGLKLVLPAGWWVIRHDRDNLTHSRAASRELSSLNIEKYYDYETMRLIYLSNLESNVSDRYFSVYMYADNHNNLSGTDAFTDEYIASVVGHSITGDMRLEKSSTSEIDGHFFRRLYFTSYDYYSEYYMQTFLIRLDKGFHLIIEVDYTEFDGADGIIEAELAKMLEIKLKELGGDDNFY